MKSNDDIEFTFLHALFNYKKIVKEMNIKKNTI